MKLEQKGDSYFITSKKDFVEKVINPASLMQAFDFAYEMVYGEGFHRKHRSGGDVNRTEKEIFQNAFQGKLGEIVLYENLKLENIEVEAPDFSIHGERVWDDVDLRANGYSICVKSIAFFSNLLLLEKDDWDEDGRYIPNRNDPNAADVHDYFVLVKIKPDIKKVITGFSEEKENLWLEIEKTPFFYDLSGFCTLKTIRHIIENKYILPKNALLNGKVKMDAKNYYVQAGDLKSVEHLYSALKEK